MDYTRKELLGMFPASWSMILTYLGRAEFSHITRKCIGQHKWVYVNWKEEDIELLRELIKQRGRRELRHLFSKYSK